MYIYVYIYIYIYIYYLFIYLFIYYILNMFNYEQSLFFLLSSSSRRKDNTANAGAQKPRRGKTREERQRKKGTYRRPIFLN